MNGYFLIVETALNATIHYQCFTPLACRDCHNIFVSPVSLFFLPCRDMRSVMCCL